MTRSRRFCVWGGGPTWTQIGSIEDRFYVRREKARVRPRNIAQVALRFSALLNNQLGPAMGALGQSAAKAAEDIERAMRPLVREHERQMAALARALGAAQGRPR